jgi:hypothetical protein
MTVATYRTVQCHFTDISAFAQIVYHVLASPSLCMQYSLIGICELDRSDLNEQQNQQAF